jgi:hypothetical protein
MTELLIDQCGLSIAIQWFYFSRRRSSQFMQSCQEREPVNVDDDRTLAP